MNNEIKRKLTSLTLMTIMLAGGMTFAAPGMMPEAHAFNPNLYVSAEIIGNFAGIQVIEIVVNDPNRSDTDTSEGRPNVELNGDDVLMAQADDGSWYAYVANQRTIDTYETAVGVGSITDIYGGTQLGSSFYSGSNSVETYGPTPNFLEGFKELSGITGTDAIQASVQITLVGVASTDAITINDVVFTAGTTQDANNFVFGNGGTDAATNLVTAINLNTDDDVTASASGADVTITAIAVGTSGNSFAVLDSTDSAGDHFGGDTTLANGAVSDTSFDNNVSIIDAQWPFIQSYDISDSSDVTITYGTGSTAQSTVISYDYDDGKDISLDRQLYPDNSYVFIDLDDSLLNLSPIADDFWAFDGDGNVDYYVGDTSSFTVEDINWEAVGFEEGPFLFKTSEGVYQLVDTGISTDIDESSDNVVLFRESNTDDNVFVNYDRADVSNIKVVDDGNSSITYNDAHSIVMDSFNGMISFANSVDEWLSGVELEILLIDEDRNLNSKSDETMSILEDEVPYIQVGEPLHLDSTGVLVTGTSTSFDNEGGTDSKIFEMSTDGSDVVVTFDWPYRTSADSGFVFNYANYDFSAVGGESGTLYMGIPVVGNAVLETDVELDHTGGDTFTITFSGLSTATDNVYFDILSFGQLGDIATDGEIIDNVERVNDAFYRLELEETDDNTSKFEGTVEYIMINQLNVKDEGTYGNIATTGDSVIIIVNDDMDGTDAITVSYLDIDSTTSEETISVKEDAHTHSGTISLDKSSYSAGNTVTVTLNDVDLNTDSDTIQTYTVNTAEDWVGDDNVWLAQLLVNDKLFKDTCSVLNEDLGLSDTSFTLVETDDESGIFVGTFKLPSEYCDSSTTKDSTNGLDLEFEYQDYSDASGKPNETSDSASISSNTGSVSFDRTVYPVPFDANDFATYGGGADLPAGDVNIVIRVDDQDFNLSASGEDTLDVSTLKLEIARGSSTQSVDLSDLEVIEIDPQSGIFEVEVLIPQQSYVDLGNTVIQQGDILTVEYKDPNDASGSENTVTDSATFDLRNGVLQSDKSVYLIGSDAIITLIEPDLNLDSEAAETWSLDLINWDSDAGAKNLSHDIFDAQPSGLRETGDNTGIFQVVIAIPDNIDGDKLERGEQIDLEYQDQGPAGADYVGDDDEDVNLTIFTSNFGATVELDQKVYTWTDKVYVTIVAPDHNFDSDSIDEIGVDSDSQINISTRGNELENYKLVETGTDTGIFTGEVILNGFPDHDADGDGSTVDGDTSGSGPTGGRIATGSDDGLTVSFEYSDGDVVLGSALIRWNIGEVQWLESSYAVSNSGVIRVIDPDMNLNPEAVDNFDVDVWSDTDAGGIGLRVTETNEATGIFEGTVSFTTTSASSGSRLAVSEGDTVTAEYEDNTLPDPYTEADELDITATTLIGTIVPPLERAPAANLRTVDAFSNSLDTVSIDQQVQITAEIQNGQDRVQQFAYLLQVQDENGVTVTLSWITGELSPYQAFSPAVSWIPTNMGIYDATVFVWQSIDNPTALSPPLSTTVTVS